MDKVEVIAETSPQLEAGEVLSDSFGPINRRARNVNSVITNGNAHLFLGIKFFCHFDNIVR